MRTIRRMALAAGCFALFLGSELGCEFGSKRAERSARPTRPPARALSSASDLAAAPPQVASAMPPLVAETSRFGTPEGVLRSIHEQKLEITPPGTPPQRLDFGRGRLLQARETNVVFRETLRGEVLAEASIGAVRGVAHGSDGSLFAVGASNGVRLPPRATSAKDFPRVAFFPGSRLFPDLEEPSYFYVDYPGEEQLYRYPFEADSAALLPIDARFPLTGCTPALALLRDGGFVCSVAGGFARKAPRGPRAEFRSTAELADPFRLLPAQRLDEFFAVSRSGQVLHLRLAPGLPLLGRFQLSASPYAAAGNGEVLAFVTVSAPEVGQRRHWLLVVTDFEGRPRFQTELESRAASADDAWLEVLVEDKNLAISEFEPLVAVGGAGQVTVWDYQRGIQLFAR